MTITQLDERGGQFDSVLVVIPTLTFVRRVDGAKRVLDVGSLRPSSQSEELLTLRAFKTPWSVEPGRNGLTADRGFNPAVLGGRMVSIQHKPHPVKPVVRDGTIVVIPNLPR